MGLSEVITYISYSLLITTCVLEGFGILKTTVFNDSQITNLYDYILMECSNFSFTKSYFICFFTTFLNNKINTIVFFEGIFLSIIYFSGC